MKTLVRIVCYCIAAVVLMIGAMLFFGVSDQPELTPDWTMTAKDLTRAKKILHEGNKTLPDEIGTIELSEADLNLMGNYLLNRFSKGKALILLRDNKIRFAVTAVLPKNRLGKYVNVSFRLGHEDGNSLPVLTKFKAGKLLLPSKVAAFVLKKIIKHSDLKQYFLLATDPVKAISVNEQRVAITYHPSQTTLRTARDLLTHNNTEGETNVYRIKLAQIVARHDPDWRLSLADLLKPLFALGFERSTAETAIEENRLIINIVNDYVNNAQATAARMTPYYPAFMYKRIDLAQHFIGAAAITASVNGQIAQAFGEEKELQDAQSGSGFSFVDLSADKAGTRFGELATANPQTARKLQQAMANINDYRDFMPDPTSLPEHMNLAEFKERYTAVNSPAYKAVASQIDVMIAETSVFKAITR
ncbi:MAG: hypothetical protein FJ190_00120 [Gammaproteobacteria bacterium]|nr:hypothetical protein [Gammaproteobacteria bacterium]